MKSLKNQPFRFRTLHRPDWLLMGEVGTEILEKVYWKLEVRVWEVIMVMRNEIRRI